MELEKQKFKLIKNIVAVNKEDSILFMEAYSKDSHEKFSDEELINRALKSEKISCLGRYFTRTT